MVSRPCNPALDELIGQEFKVLDKGFVRLVDYMGNDAAIVQAARVSYGDGTKSSGEDSGLISYLLRHKHTSPFEMCSLKFHCKLPIFVARQWIRHRTAKVNELSARYSIIKDEFFMPDVWRGQAKDNKQGSDGTLDYDGDYYRLYEERHGAIMTDRRGQILIAEEVAFDEYNQRIKFGICRELARTSLPLSTYTEWYWKIDLHNLLHFLDLRCDKHAQKEIRDYADVVAHIVELGFPFTWEHFCNHVLNAVTFSADEMIIIKQWAKAHPLYFESLQDYGITGSRAREFKEKLGVE